MAHRIQLEQGAPLPPDAVPVDVPAELVVAEVKRPKPSPLAETHIAHRRATAALASERPDLRWLHETWAAYNRDYYDGAMVAPYILLDEPSEPRSYGQFAPGGGIGSRGQIMIRPSLLAGTHPDLQKASERTCRRFVADVLLHESVHQWQHEADGRTDGGYHGHGPAFRDKANSIGARLGLPRVRTSKRRGPDKELPSCSQWPHCVRPLDYYEGAYVPIGGDVSIRQVIRAANRLADLLERLGGDAVDEMDVHEFAGAYRRVANGLALHRDKAEATRSGATGRGSTPPGPEFPDEPLPFD